LIKSWKSASYLVTPEVIAFADTPQAAVQECPVKKCDKGIALPVKVLAIQLKDELEAKSVGHFDSKKMCFFKI
jgi:hypothetical protein